jgi:predicted O-methyltransferase YrrM
MLPTYTDKFDLGYFDAFYYRILSRDITRLLEIGIYAGGSIRLWHQMFPAAEVYAVDVVPCAALNCLGRVRQLTGDAYTPAFVAQLPTFDVMIDDGPHTFASMAFFIQHYLPKLNPGGVMVVEDIIDPRWTPDLLALIPDSYEVEVVDMRGKQKTPELLAKWQNGLDVIIISNQLPAGNK